MLFNSACSARRATVLATLAAVSACASSPPEPLGAVVDPMQPGFESYRKDGLLVEYTWRVRDNDGIEHTVTSRPDSMQAVQSAQGLSTCMNECMMTLRNPESTAAKCPIALEHPVPRLPALFPVFLSCAKSVELTDYAETTQPYATEYRVRIYTGDGARSMAVGETPTSRSLGAGRLLTRTAPMAKAAVTLDVDRCLRTAGAREPVANCGPGCTTIAPMLGRFDACLRSLSYDVRPFTAW